jgi:myo-inositol-1(or 4)-monophosphatase
MSRFDNVNLWDIAGGIPLVHAAGGTVRIQENGQWLTLERFSGTTDQPDLRTWRRPMIIGAKDAVDTFIATLA